MIRDPSAILLGALDPITNVLHFYREFYQTDKVLSEVATAIKEMIADIPVGMLHPMLIDPSSNQRSKINARTYKQQLNMEHKLVFTDANNNLVDGLFKTRDLMAQGKIKFARSMVNTIREGCEYRYANEKEQNMKKNLGDKPLDKDNHAMDCLRYIVQALPYSVTDKKVIHTDNTWRANFLVNEEKTYEGGFRF